MSATDGFDVRHVDRATMPFEYRPPLTMGSPTWFAMELNAVMNVTFDAINRELQTDD